LIYYMLWEALALDSKRAEKRSNPLPHATHTLPPFPHLFVTDAATGPPPNGRPHRRRQWKARPSTPPGVTPPPRLRLRARAPPPPPPRPASQQARPRPRARALGRPPAAGPPRPVGRGRRGRRRRRRGPLPGGRTGRAGPGTGPGLSHRVWARGEGEEEGGLDGGLFRVCVSLSLLAACMCVCEALSHDHHHYSRIAPNRAPVADAAAAVSAMGDRTPRAMPAPNCRAQKRPASPPARAAPPVAAAPALAMRPIWAAETALAASWGPRPGGIAMGGPWKVAGGERETCAFFNVGRLKFLRDPLLPRLAFHAHLPPASATRAGPCRWHRKRRPSWC